MPKRLMTLEDLEDLAQRLSDCRFHLDLYRTRNRSGRWEVRLQPFNWDDLKGDVPYARSNDLATALSAAIKTLPEQARETVNAQEYSSPLFS